MLLHQVGLRYATTSSGSAVCYYIKWVCGMLLHQVGLRYATTSSGSAVCYYIKWVCGMLLHQVGLRYATTSSGSAVCPQSCFASDCHPGRDGRALPNSKLNWADTLMLILVAMAPACYRFCAATYRPFRPFVVGAVVHVVGDVISAAGGCGT